MIRRNFIQRLFAIPLLGWLPWSKPVPAVPSSMLRDNSQESCGYSCGEIPDGLTWQCHDQDGNLLGSGTWETMPQITWPGDV